MGQGQGEGCHHTAVRTEGSEDRGMSAPTAIERDYYAKLVGRTITGIQWEELDDQPLPVLLLNGDGRDLQPAHAVVLADPEGNGPGHLDHNL